MARLKPAKCRKHYYVTEKRMTLLQIENGKSPLWFGDLVMRSMRYCTKCGHILKIYWKTKDKV